MGPTRWQPRKTVCTQTREHTDLPGVLHVVKFCQGQIGAAAMISEVICHELYRAGGMHVLDAVIVEASEAFATGWNETLGTGLIDGVPEPPIRIVAGSYFGTVYISGVYDGPLASIEDVEKPEHLVLIWVFDCLVCNIDRAVRGNLILMPWGKDRKFRLIAADHSDCFCGSTEFSTGTWRELMIQRTRVGGVLVPEAIQASGGEDGLLLAIQTARYALGGGLGEAFDHVPQEWWNFAHILPEQVEETLWNRLDALPRLIDTGFWRGDRYGNLEGIPLIQL